MYKMALTAAICLASFILYVIYYANSGGKGLFIAFARSIPYGDKLGHFFLFGILTFLVVMASRFRSFTLGRLPIYYGVAFVSLFVFGEEISQLLLPARTFSLADLTADTLGIITSTVLAYIASKHIAKTSQ